MSLLPLACRIHLISLCSFSLSVAYILGARLARGCSMSQKNQAPGYPQFDLPCLHLASWKFVSWKIILMLLLNRKHTISVLETAASQRVGKY